VEFVRRRCCGDAGEEGLEIAKSSLETLALEPTDFQIGVEKAKVLTKVSSSELSLQTVVK